MMKRCATALGTLQDDERERASAERRSALSRDDTEMAERERRRRLSNRARNRAMTRHE